MNFQELNDDRRMLSSASKLNSLIDRGFSERARKMVNNHAALGAIALAMPLFGLDNIIYLIVLWHMYYSLCNMAKKSFNSNKTKSFAGAVIVNVLVASVLEMFCNIIPIAGSFIGGLIIGAASIKISGAAYLKALEIAHGGDTAERYRLN